MRLSIKKLYDDAVIPERAYKYDSGLDLFSYLQTEFITLQPGERQLIATGIAVRLPEPHYDVTGQEQVYEGQIRPKSGRALKEGLTVLNTPGTIDSSYINEIKIIVINMGTEEIIIKNKQKIAQLVVTPVLIPELIIVDDLENTDRGINGFGSTGI